MIALILFWYTPIKSISVLTKFTIDNVPQEEEYKQQKQLLVFFDLSDLPQVAIHNGTLLIERTEHKTNRFCQVIKQSKSINPFRCVMFAQVLVQFCGFWTWLGSVPELRRPDMSVSLQTVKIGWVYFMFLSCPSTQSWSFTTAKAIQHQVLSVDILQRNLKT